MSLTYAHASDWDKLVGQDADKAFGQEFYRSGFDVISADESPPTSMAILPSPDSMPLPAAYQRGANCERCDAQDGLYDFCDECCAAVRARRTHAPTEAGAVCGCLWRRNIATRSRMNARALHRLSPSSIAQLKWLLPLPLVPLATLVP